MSQESLEKIGFLVVMGFFLIEIILDLTVRKDSVPYVDLYWGNRDKNGNYKPPDDKINPGKLDE